jgi:Rrf2 family nitric oxide-sensitive transcriptional repressor
MRLAEYTDYTLRVLMYCATHRDERITIAGLAEHHAISKNHLMKIVNDLARQGVLETTRGRGGGLRLVEDPARIRIGDIVRACETDFRLVECFDPVTDACTLTPTCRLKHLFGAALQAYFRTLDAATLADIAEPLPSRSASRGVPVPIELVARRGAARPGATPVQPGRPSSRGRASHGP